jgi:alpha-L-rhamnosidase
MKIATSLYLLCILFLAQGQTSQPFVSHPSQLDNDAFADWIIPEEELGVFYFRKNFDLDKKPSQFLVHVSADARYRLFVNGQLVCWGPAVGDVENWHYETIDIAPYLREGRNIIASQVWNWGKRNGTRQQSVQTAFIMQGDSAHEHKVNTNASWKVMRDAGYHALTMTDDMVGGGYIAGATDSLVVAMHPHGWKDVGYDDSHWSQARSIGKGNHTGLDTWKGTAWKLRPRVIPFMEQDEERTLKVRQVTGIAVPENPDSTFPLTVPANTRVEILLDNLVLTMGFPQLHISGGKGSQIKIQYQEAMFDAEGQKGNRNDWEGKEMKGYYDVVMPDGGKQLFEPLWVRVFRFAKLTIETDGEPLIIEDYYNIYTAYPMKQHARCVTDDGTLDQIWDASWRTARLCALETFMDCPYYEQVQYIGDTRIQALISLYIAGDDRMVRNAIEQFYNSMQPMGLTKSAHPTDGVQIIPPFSLLLIGMIHDYYMYNNDGEFLQQFMPGIRFILDWFILRIAPNGILGPLPYWNHVDGGTDFLNGSPPGISEGGSAHMSLLLAYALDKANELMRAFGYPCDAERFGAISTGLKQKTMELCFDYASGLIAETPQKDQFSQHTNIFAILTNTIEADRQPALVQSILEDKSLIQTTLYFKFYLFQALKQAGLGNEVVGLMSKWKSFLDMGFTTFPEHGLYSRSDCHAWSAHPMLAFLTVICGIEPADPGFTTVEIRPFMGDLTEVSGHMPHPLGDISVHYSKMDQGETMYQILLPKGLSGQFIAGDTVYPLLAGQNIFTIVP